MRCEGLRDHVRHFTPPVVYLGSFLYSAVLLSLSILFITNMYVHM